MDSCPFTLRRLNADTFLVREQDEYDENPHIYVRKYCQSSKTVIVITDTGCGTRYPNRLASSPQEWNIKTVIERNLQLTDEVHYLIILSHCHYDHILGLPQFLSPTCDEESLVTNSHTSIVSSGYDKSFTTPYQHLTEHSLCKDMRIPTPHYKTTIWAKDLESITYAHVGGLMDLPIITIHTPGHTPDSLSWYDTQHRALYIGDSFLQREWNDQIGNEGPTSILLVNDSNVYDWWYGTKKLLEFVKVKNADRGERMRLSAGHVTADVDAEECISGVLDGMAKVLRKEAGFVDKGVKRGERFGLWFSDAGRFTMAAPVRVIDEGRERIRKTEWQISEAA